MSRSKTPWDDSNELSPLEVFIKEHYHAHFNNHHNCINEKELLLSLIPKQCPYCNKVHFKKKGFNTNHIQRYFCNECHRYFNVLTNTIFDNHKISISEWIEFLLYLFGYESIQEIAKSNKNSTTTSKYWLKKLFLMLEHYQENIVLQSNVYLDETFYKVINKEIKLKEDGKQFRGLSINQICIGIATDGIKTFAKVEGLGKTSEAKTIETFKDHIETEAHLIHDKEKAHNILIKLLSLTHEAYDGNEIKKLEDKDNPLEPINRTIYFLKKFLNAHPGFSREELQGYLDLFVFMSNEKGEPLDKVKRMVYLSLTTPISLKYRDYYKKKPVIE